MSEDNSEIESLKAKIKELEALLEKEKESSINLINLHKIVQDSYLEILGYNDDHVKNLIALLNSAINRESTVTNLELLDEIRYFSNRYRNRHQKSAQEVRGLK